MKTALCLTLFTIAAMAEDKLPDGPGKATLVKVCSDCHGPEVVIGMTHDRAGWQDVVTEMVDKGATATPEQVKEIVDYLLKAFPKKPS